MSLIQMVHTSSNPFIKSLWNDDVGPGKAPATSSIKIRNSAAALIRSLRQCVPNYIRCIKPNDHKKQLTANAARVEFQVSSHASRGTHCDGLCAALGVP